MADEIKLDVAIRPGGVYIVNGNVVNADGAVIPGWIIDANGVAVLAPVDAPKGK